MLKMREKFLYIYSLLIQVYGQIDLIKGKQPKAITDIE